MGGTPVNLLASGLGVKPLENAEDRCVIRGRQNARRSAHGPPTTTTADHKDGGGSAGLPLRQGQATSCDASASEEFYTTAPERSTLQQSGDFSG